MHVLKIETSTKRQEKRGNHRKNNDFRQTLKTASNFEMKMAGVDALTN